MAKRFNGDEKVQGKDGASQGVVIKFSIGLGHSPPESLTVPVDEFVGRDVFTHADELLGAVANDPDLPPDDGQVDDDGLDRLRDLNTN